MPCYEKLFLILQKTLELDFLREVRLTPTSYDARISLTSGLGTRLVVGLLGFGTGVTINKRDEALAVSKFGQIKT